MTHHHGTACPVGAHIGRDRVPALIPSWSSPSWPHPSSPRPVIAAPVMPPPSWSAKADHPRLPSSKHRKSWMAEPSPAMTDGTNGTEQPHPDSGFTLLEIIVAVAVLGFLLLALTQGTQFGLRAWRTQTDTVQRHTEMEAADRALRHLIERLVSGDMLKSRPPLIGGRSGIDFVTTLPPGPGVPPDPTAEVRLSVDAAHRLLLTWVPAPHATWIGRPVPPERTILLYGVERLECSYWKMVPGGGGSWVREWTDPRPPALVRLRIIFPAGDARRWPDIVAAPRVDEALSSNRPYNSSVTATITPRTFVTVTVNHAG